MALEWTPVSLLPLGRASPFGCHVLKSSSLALTHLGSLTGSKAAWSCLFHPFLPLHLGRPAAGPASRLLDTMTFKQATPRPEPG